MTGIIAIKGLYDYCISIMNSVDKNEPFWYNKSMKDELTQKMEEVRKKTLELAIEKISLLLIWFNKYPEIKSIDILEEQAYNDSFYHNTYIITALNGVAIPADLQQEFSFSETTDLYGHLEGEDEYFLFEAQQFLLKEKINKKSLKEFKEVLSLGAISLYNPGYRITRTAVKNAIRTMKKEIKKFYKDDNEG